MIYVRYFWGRIFTVFISVCVITFSMGESSYDYISGDIIDEAALSTNESSTIYYENSTSSTPSSSFSLILKALVTNAILVNSSVRDKISFTSLSVRLTTPQNTTAIVPRSTLSTPSPIDQVNSYLNDDIISHIQRCDPNMRLNDMCQMYSIDNDTKPLTYRLNIEYETFRNLSNALVDQSTVRKLNQFCSPSHWCVRNLTEKDIDVTKHLIRKKGHFFCELEQCRFRLLTFINSCPTFSSANLSLPTVKLLPILCALYSEQQSWDSTQCTKEIVHLLYALSAFWPQLETCFNNITSGFNACTLECHAFIDIFEKVEHQCNGSAPFLSRVPATAWYQSFNLTQTCHHKNSSTNLPLIHIMKNFFSSNISKHRFYSKSVPTFAFIVLIIICFIVMSCALCFHSKAKRQFDDNYEYTRLHDTSFELETSSEMPHISSTTSGVLQDGAQSRFRSSEHQHLLHVQS